MPDPSSVVVVGAGIGGLAAAVQLAGAGLAVTVLERGTESGGKMRAARVAGRTIDAGPTVLTMRWVFEELFAKAGANLSDFVTLEPAEILARHAWPDGARLDLFADRERSADAIGRAFGSRNAAAYRTFMADAARIYATIEAPFLRAQAPTVTSMLRQVGSLGFGALTRIDAFRSMWDSLSRRFSDPRLVQLFARYATYVGSSPFDAPATMNLVAHVEATGVHRVHGGMDALASALAALARRAGVTFRFDADVTRILVERGRAAGVALADGSVVEADAVLFNGDVSAVSSLLGARGAPAPTTPDRRSLSAVTYTMVARANGFPLVHQNVFFSGDYPAEFVELFEMRRVPDAPTVYVCAQDRGDDGGVDDHEERLLLVVNAPATGDEPSRWSEDERRRCELSTRAVMKTCGLELETLAQQTTTPVERAQAFPCTRGRGCRWRR
jgi:1-hydroxycarotenoid 3,4-desaturase